jgi:glycosyltransferase involved in cell wall biosynthesis
MNYENFLNTYENKKVIENSNKVTKFPAVSVCVQTYQHKDFIVQCLDGILMQETTFEYEILLGEDASKDGTREICIEYANKYPDKIRLFLHHRENNIEISGNPSGRFNFLYNLGFSKGKYIALCEGDDYWTDPFKLQKQVEFLEQNLDYSICFSDAKIEYSYKDSIIDSHNFQKERYKKEYNLYDILKGNFINTCTVIIRCDERPYPDYFLSSPVGDWVTYIHYAERGKIYYLKEVTSVYRIHDEGIFQHHHNWSIDRHIRSRNQFIDLRRNLLRQFSSNLEAVKIINERINNAYMELIILESKKRPFDLRAFTRQLQCFMTSGMTIKNTLRLVKKTAESIN